VELPILWGCAHLECFCDLLIIMQSVIMIVREEYKEEDSFPRWKYFWGTVLFCYCVTCMFDILMIFILFCIGYAVYCILFTIYVHFFFLFALVGC
jgi:hypothetical protein